MIAVERSFPWVVRLLAPWVWRSRARTARKLLGFSATEAGSALDMLRAAELEPDPEVRRLFFKHALDEARHAEMFRREAVRLDPHSRVGTYELVHAQRQDLYARMDRLGFLAFVFLAERRGQAHFAALARHFAADPELSELFSRIEREERFHVAYAHKLLGRYEQEGRRGTARRALLKVQGARAWQAWRRQGRMLGDLTARVILSAVFVVVVPVFAALQAVFGRAEAGWVGPATASPDRADPRRQF